MLSLRSSPLSLPRPPVLGAIASALLFVAVLAWWIHVFRTPDPTAPARPAAPAPIDVLAGTTLFGAQPDHGAHDQLQLLGILAFDPRHAAAVISVGGQSAQVVHLNGTVADATTLSEVRTHSIIVERNGVRREIALPAAQDPSAFMH